MKKIKRKVGLDVLLSGLGRLPLEASGVYPRVPAMTQSL